MRSNFLSYSLRLLHVSILIFSRSNLWPCHSTLENAFARKVESRSPIIKSMDLKQRSLERVTVASNLQHRRRVRENRQQSALLDRYRYDTRGIEVRIGQGFRKRLPLSMFQVREEDEKDGDWKLTLRTAENHKLFSNSWIYIDDSHRELVGFPMQGNEGLFEFLVRADGLDHRIIKRPLTIRVVKDIDRASHRVKMTLGRGFRQFMSKSRIRIEFATFLSEYLQNSGITTRMKDIWIYETDSVSKSLSWILTTFNRNVCDHVVTELLPSRLLSRGHPHPDLVAKFKPKFIFTNVSVQISEYCPKPVKNRAPKSPSASQIVFGPLVVIVIVIILGSPLVIAHVIRKNIRKRDRRRQFSQSQHLQLNGAAAPIWVDHEEEDKNVPKERNNGGRAARYRWNPDLTGRPILVVPNTPPSRRSLSRTAKLSEEEHLLTPVSDNLVGMKTQRVQNSLLTWHGLPSEQCVEADGIQLPSVVSDFTSSISRPLKDVLEYFSGKPETTQQPQLTSSISDPVQAIASSPMKTNRRLVTALPRSEPCSRQSSSDNTRRYGVTRQDTTKSDYINGYVTRDRPQLDLGFRDTDRAGSPVGSYKWMLGRTNSLHRQESRETTASERSETSILGTAFNKVSSLINLNNRQTPKVIRIFLSDESEDTTRSSSFDRSYILNDNHSSLISSRVSSFERPSPSLISSQRSSSDKPSPSLVSSQRSSLDKPSPSLVSSQRSSFEKPSPSLISSQLSSFDRISPSLSSNQLNSFDTLCPVGSFSRDGSCEDQSSISDIVTSFDRESLGEFCQPHLNAGDEFHFHDQFASMYPLENGLPMRNDKIAPNISPEHLHYSTRRLSTDRLRSDGSSESSFDNPRRSLTQQESLRIMTFQGERKTSRQESMNGNHKLNRENSVQNDSQIYSKRKNSLHPDDSRKISRSLTKQKSIYSPLGRQEVTNSPLHRIDTTNVHIQTPRYGQQTLSYPGIINERSFIRTAVKTEVVYENSLNVMNGCDGPSRV